MLSWKNCVKLRTNLLNKFVLSHAPLCMSICRLQNYHGLPCTKNQALYLNSIQSFKNCSRLQIIHRKWYSKELPSKHELGSQELKQINELFPLPRQTLNNLSAKTPQKIFDVHYKQYVAPKIGKKKAQNLDWTCTYSFIWPEKMKFECTAISKRQAADKAAYQALYWLYINKRIDKKGCPIYDRNILNEIKHTLNEPFRVNINDKSVERIERIWEDYQNGIKEIYERVAKEAELSKVEASQVLIKDSSIDEDDVSYKEDCTIPEEIVLDTNTPIHPLYGIVLKTPTSKTLNTRRLALERTFQDYNDNITELPIDGYADQITNTLKTNKVCVIVGAAGCGKSTRVPPALLRDMGVNGTVIVAEPRRVAAIGLAERVASELGEDVGETVGYQVRLNSKLPRPPAGSILYCTSGVLLNRLQKNPGLIGCSHVIIDEAHERDVNTDITMLLLKRALEINQELRVVVMSATLDIDVFTRYFDKAPVIEVPGRVYPVDILHLDDIQKKFHLNLRVTKENCEREDGRPQICVAEIVETIKAIDKHGKEGAILVFLPGWAEINQAKQMLDEHFNNPGLHLILPVHSRLSTLDQTKIFSVPPPGVRKIVLSTNVCETSVTVPDVLHVLDAGGQRENVLREGTGTTSLETVWVSLAGAKQRCGRAGRVQPGVCYRMYTKEKESEFTPHTTPEILRIPLERTVLDCKSYAPDDKAQDFLSQLPEPPSEAAIKFAVSELVDIGALTKSEQLTRLGKLLSNLSISPRVGVSVIHSASLGTLLSTANIAVHCDTHIELFANAAQRREEIREIKRKYSKTSDHAALHWLQQDYEDNLQENGWRAMDSWCDKYQLRKERLSYVKAISGQYMTQLIKSKLIEPHVEATDASRFSDIDEMSVATLLTGVNAILTTRKCVHTKGKLRTMHQVFTSTGEKAHLASESVNHSLTKRTNKQTLLAHCGGHHSRERRALVVYRSSVITPHVPLLFCKGHIFDKIVEENPETTILSLPKHKLEIHVPTSQAPIIRKAREMIWSTLQYHIDRDINNLEYNELENIARFKIRLLKSVAKILVEATNSYNSNTINIEDFE